MSAPEAPPAPTPAPQPWAGPTPGSYRLGYEGPGVPIWRTRGAPAKRRDRWIWSVDHAGSLTLAALGIARALAYYGDPDGSRIRVSEARIAAEITMADGTVSRAICELEDAGYLQVRRSRWHRCPEDGQLAREVNHYTLTLPPSDAEARGIKGSRKRRPSSPTPRQNHQAAQERRDAERRQEVTAALAEALAGADADLEAPSAGPDAACIAQMPALGAYLDQLEDQDETSRGGGSTDPDDGADQAPSSATGAQDPGGYEESPIGAERRAEMMAQIRKLLPPRRGPGGRAPP